MDYIIFIFIALAALYFIGSLGGKSSVKKSSSLSISNFIDNSKQYADMQECVDIIGNYLYQGGSKLYKKDAEEFPDFIEKLIKFYKKERKDSVKELASTEKWLEDEILKMEKDGLHEEDIRATKEEINIDIKVLKKAVKWYDREIDKVKKDMKPIMKKYMTYILKTDDIPELYEIGLPKDLPDSYYV